MVIKHIDIVELLFLFHSKFSGWPYPDEDISWVIQSELGLNIFHIFALSKVVVPEIFDLLVFLRVRDPEAIDMVSQPIHIIDVLCDP